MSEPRKMAIFVEGQSELIFVRNLILKITSPAECSFECYELRSNEKLPVPFHFFNPYAKVHFQIVNVGGDERVLTVIKEREPSLIAAGYSKIIGLRDMYSNSYKKYSPEKIDENVNQLFFDGTQFTINQMIYKKNIKFYFAIMEIEAWWLGMYKIFERISPILTPDFIHSQFNYDLSLLDPETTFFNPANEVKHILELAGISYSKKWSEVESIVSHIEDSDIIELIESDRCLSFLNFSQELL